MPRSAYNCVIRFDPDQLNTSDPVDTALVKDALANNLMHLADEFCQNRVKFVARNNALTAENPYLEPQEASLSNDKFYRIARFGPFPLTCNSTGDAYVLRVRVACNSANSHLTTLRVVITGPSLSDISAADADPERTITFTTSSTSIAWIAGATLSDHLIQLRTGFVQSELLSSGRSTHDFPDDFDQGVLIYEAYADVWGKSANVVSSPPRLYGLDIAEYVGS